MASLNRYLTAYRLNKRQGKAALATLGADPALYEKVPTADLEEEKPGIADEVALGWPTMKLTIISKVSLFQLKPKKLSNLGGIRTAQTPFADYDFWWILEVKISIETFKFALRNEEVMKRLVHGPLKPNVFAKTFSGIGCSSYVWQLGFSSR